MKSAARLLGLFVLGSLAFTACDGDDDTIGSASGASGGTAAKGGKGGGSGSGGSNAGKGGTGGTSTDTGGSGGSSAARGGTGGTSSGRGGTSARGGSSGKGGSSSGTAGDGASGSAGEDGTGGATAGTPGVGGTGIIGMGGAGAGGEAGNAGGEAGGGGSGPAPTPKVCTYECTLDTDCDPDHGYTCVDGVCLDAERACNAHEDCVGWATALTEPCSMDTDCAYNALYGDLCIDVGGTGLCAMIPFEGECAFGESTEAPKFGAAETATVCLDLSGRCDAHQCFKGCTSDPDFCTTPPNNKRGPVCNTVTGKCGGCTGDGQCGGSGTSHCNVATGVCGCETNEECGGLAGMDTCIAGKCSCSASSCTTFPDATPICQ